MDDSLAREVRRRAGNVCEYCRIPQQFYPAPFQTNLALACLHCNAHKGPNIAGIDPKGEQLTALFNPRRHKWQRHFRYRGTQLIGRTAVGRTTIEVLNMNGAYLQQLRRELLEEGLFAPTDLK
jgi:hypothetical protein